MGIISSIAENVLDFLDIESVPDAEAPSAQEYAATPEQEIQMMADIQLAFDEMRR